MNTKAVLIVVSLLLAFTAGCSKEADSNQTNAESSNKSVKEAYDKAYNGVSSNSIKRKSD